MYLSPYVLFCRWLLDVDYRILIPLLFSIIAVYTANWYTVRRENRKERKRQIELYNFVESWISVSLRSIELYFPTMDSISESFADINHLAPNLPALNLNFKMIFDIDSADSYRIFISKREISNEDQIQSFHTLYLCLSNLDTIIADYNTRLGNIMPELERRVTRMTEIDRNISTNEKELGTIVLDIDNTISREKDALQLIKLTIVKDILRERYSNYLRDYFAGLSSNDENLMRLPITSKLVVLENKLNFIRELNFDISRYFQKIESEILIYDLEIVSLRAYFASVTAEVDDIRIRMMTNIRIVREEIQNFEIRRNKFVSINKY